jgi:hypothetical protein
MAKLDTDIDPKNLNKLASVAGVVTIVIVAFYATGLYRNYLQIKKLKQEDSKSLKPEDL